MRDVSLEQKRIDEQEEAVIRFREMAGRGFLREHRATF